MNAEVSGTGPGWIVREAGPGDLDALARFSARMARESEGRELDRDAIRASLAALLEDTDVGSMFIAERDDGEPIGCTMLNGREWSEWRNGLFFWVTGMYVLPEYRRYGVRFDLHRHAVDWARTQPHALGLRACVHRDNDLQTVLGIETAKRHNRPEFGLEPMHETPYVVIEVEF